MKLKPIVLAVSIFGLTYGSASVADGGAAFVAGSILGAIVGHGSHHHYAHHHDHGHHHGHHGHDHSGYHAAQHRCANRYRSYSYHTDTYVTYGGDVRTCRYVRPWI